MFPSLWPQRPPLIKHSAPTSSRPSNYYHKLSEDFNLKNVIILNILIKNVPILLWNDPVMKRSFMNILVKQQVGRPVTHSFARHNFKLFFLFSLPKSKYQLSSLSVIHWRKLKKRLGEETKLHPRIPLHRIDLALWHFFHYSLNTWVLKDMKLKISGVLKT